MTRKNADTEKLYFHFLADGRRLRYGERETVEAGRAYRATGALRLCSNGMHASEKALDALKYAPGAVVCRVRLGGGIVEDDDKVCARERTVVWMADATRTLREFACYAAEWAMDRVEARGHKVDPRSRNAVAVARLRIIGQATDDELGAARKAAGVAYAAAGDAADAAAAAAADAADAAADAADAAYAAAAYAAYAAADAAYAADAARAEARRHLNAKLEEMLLALAPVATGGGS